MLVLLGCGAVGGSATSDNVSPMNLINIRRIAWGLREVSDLRGAACVEDKAAAKTHSLPQQPQRSCGADSHTDDAISKLVEAVLERIEKKL